MEAQKQGNKVNIKDSGSTKGIKQMDAPDIVMDFGQFQKAYPNLSEPKSAPAGGETAKSESGDKDLGKMTKSTAFLSESLKSLKDKFSKEELLNAINEMYEEGDVEEGADAEVAKEGDVEEGADAEVAKEGDVEEGCSDKEE